MLTVRWRMVSWSVWTPATNFESCLGLILWVTIRRFAWVSIKVTSISAMSALVFDVNLLGVCCWDQEDWWPWETSLSKNCNNGVTIGCTTLEFAVVLLSSFTTLLGRSWSLWASRDCRRCSSSFTNSMAPPSIEAWSPYTKKEKLIRRKEYQKAGTDMIFSSDQKKKRHDILFCFTYSKLTEFVEQC